MRIGYILTAVMIVILAIVLAFGAIWNITHGKDGDGYCFSLLWLIILVGMAALIRK